MSKLWSIKELVQGFIDKGATTVEEVHRAIADMPFDNLEKVEPIAARVKEIRKVHDETVGNVYDLIRFINKEVGKLAGELLDRTDKLKKDGGENY
ncbi:MAG: hypothetical protein AB1921_07415 [Thermodesulfobacteriota bacterium]